MAIRTIDEFRGTLKAQSPPADVGAALQALWWSGKGDWDRAHKVVQQHEDDADCNWVHAHLHHQEGDMRNAGGWYQRAGKAVATCSVKEEWDALVAGFLSKR
jgi:hypothetical protein